MNTEPFLPSQRKKPFASQPLKVVLLWALLIISFVCLYQVFTAPSSQAPHHHAHAHRSDDGFGGLLGLLCGGLFVLLLGWAFWNQRNIRRAVVMNGEGLELLGRGEVQKARALFEAMGQKYHRSITVRGLAQYNVAQTSVLAGDLERATRELVDLEKRDGLKTVQSLKPLAATSLAECYALVGQLDLAAPWLDEAEQKRATAGEPPKLTGALTLVRAIIACRKGAPAEATRLIDANWQTIEGLAGDQLRPLRLVRAFAVAAAGGPRDDGAVDRLLAPLRESRPGSLRYLGVAWPEMAAFLELNHL